MITKKQIHDEKPNLCKHPICFEKALIVRA